MALQTAFDGAISNDKEWEAAVSKQGLILVDVHSAWCGPTNCLGLTIAKLRAELADVPLVVFRADCDAVPSLAEFRGSARSTFLVFKRGVRVRVVHGPDEPAIEAAVRAHGHSTERGQPPSQASDAVLRPLLRSVGETVRLPAEWDSVVLGVGWEAPGAPLHIRAVVLCYGFESGSLPLARFDASTHKLPGASISVQAAQSLQPDADAESVTVNLLRLPPAYRHLLLALEIERDIQTISLSRIETSLVAASSLQLSGYARIANEREGEMASYAFQANMLDGAPLLCAVLHIEPIAVGDTTVTAMGTMYESVDDLALHQALFG